MTHREPWSTYDTNAIPEAPLSALASSLVADFLASHRPRQVPHSSGPAEALAALRFFDLRRERATIAGILILGTTPEDYLPGARVEFVRWRGNEQQRRLLSGPMGTVISSAHALLAPCQSDYPEWALKELLHNALAHRDYASVAPTLLHWFDDRIEITNPGGLSGLTTAASLCTFGEYRNPVVGDALKKLGFVNRWGLGLQQVDELLATNGYPPLQIKADAEFFRVSVMARVLA